MKYFEEFHPSGCTFRERIGEPNAFDAGIGYIALRFSDLEEIVSNALLQLLALIPRYGRIVTSELSFKNKVDMMAVGAMGKKMRTSKRGPNEMPLSMLCGHR